VLVPRNPLFDSAEKHLLRILGIHTIHSFTFLRPLKHRWIAAGNRMAPRFTASQYG
jgi:hypothetical protein